MVFSVLSLFCNKKGIVKNISCPNGSGFLPNYNTGFEIILDWVSKRNFQIFPQIENYLNAAIVSSSMDCKQWPRRACILYVWVSDSSIETIKTFHKDYTANRPDTGLFVL